MERREVIGSVELTTSSASLSNSALELTVVDGSSFPTGDSNPFVIVINRGKPLEEKILVSSRSGNVFTLKERGYDGPIARSHPAGSDVDHVLDATAIQDMNSTTYDNQVLIWMETA